ncbi:hypothetical protein [Lactobacillus jensenii]|jgi:hypothetical protein|uniref:DUF8208 domain-containing protein n=1 Tax=Lactobacillus jensenii TaxID=109790 RepID=A0ABU9FK11_LACJE|nr:hypothetical protein [Lactobacillus jensenii]MCF1843655.1 hypothetical protein [Lactobacillus jensenii]MCW8115638.1 hypothetical protein [Lactobacillus jensenii]MDK7256567.1 hypothetical protein [Lactobacillus jensenii]MDT9545433.1 hypothetical protein [Lactobacillus jensenii]
MGTKLLILAQSYIFTGWIDLGKAISDMFGGGGDSKEDLTNAANSLDNIRPYLHFQDAVGQVFNWIKWGIIKAFYNLANGAEDLATHSLDFSKLLSDAGLKDWIQGYILGAAAAVMIAVLVWIGIKMMLGKEKTPVQNIILQAIIATFLMFNLQPLTNWVVDQSRTSIKPKSLMVIHLAFHLILSKEIPTISPTWFITIGRILKRKDPVRLKLKAMKTMVTTVGITKTVKNRLIYYLLLT